MPQKFSVIKSEEDNDGKATDTPIKEDLSLGAANITAGTAAANDPMFELDRKVVFEDGTRMLSGHKKGTSNEVDYWTVSDEEITNNMNQTR